MTTNPYEHKEYQRRLSLCNGMDEKSRFKFQWKIEKDKYKEQTKNNKV